MQLLNLERNGKQRIREKIKLHWCTEVGSEPEKVKVSSILSWFYSRRQKIALGLVAAVYLKRFMRTFLTNSVSF